MIGRPQPRMGNARPSDSGSRIAKWPRARREQVPLRLLNASVGWANRMVRHLGKRLKATGAPSTEGKREQNVLQLQP